MQKAVIKESLRLSSGVWTPMTRIVPTEGAQIGGHFIPGGVRNLLAVSCDLTIHSDRLSIDHSGHQQPLRPLKPAALSRAFRIQT